LASAVALSAPDANAKLRKALRFCLDRLHFFATSSSSNFLQHKLLLQAESARLRGELSAALKHYNDAIELAEQQDLFHLVGIANERAALCCLDQGQSRLAMWYIDCAKGAFSKWGATAKVTWLEHKYACARSITLMTTEGKTAGNVASLRDDGFDLAAALQASRFIASSNSGDLLLPHLMQVVRLQAGAETAQLFALEGDKLRHEATATAEGGDVMLFPLSTTTRSGSFSPAIVNYVLHTRDDLMLDEADADPRFSRCSHIAEQRVKSIICMGIRHQGEMLGVIYLEHKQLVGAFNEKKLEWLRILSSELGLAMWGARLGRYRDYVSKFAPTEVSKRIDANPQGPDLETKDCDVSIMFADVAGYSRLVELLGNRGVADLVNSAFSHFVDEIHRFEGVLLETRGDELLVMFGDDDPTKHRWKAAKAALGIRRAAAQLNKELPNTHPPLIMNIGINSGIASVGIYSIDARSGARWHYGAYGTEVNVAARLREFARNGSILMSEASLSQIADEFVVEDMGRHQLKNISNMVRIYRLVDERQRF